MKWVVMLLLVPLLAGCAESGSADGETGPKTQQVAPPPEGLGSISGVVVDTTYMPIGNVSIVMIGQGLNATSNFEGQFVFEGVEPGAYFLEATHPEFNTTQSGVNVEMGLVASPSIMMSPGENKDPYHITVQKNAFNTFSTPLVVVYSWGQPIDLDGQFATLVVDGVWQGDLLVATDPDKAIQTVITGDGFGRTYQTPLEFSRHYQWPENAEAEPNQLNWYSRPNFDSVSFQAEGQMFFTMWYHEPAPEGWSKLNGDS